MKYNQKFVVITYLWHNFRLCNWNNCVYIKKERKIRFQYQNWSVTNCYSYRCCGKIDVMRMIWSSLHWLGVMTKQKNVRKFHTTSNAVIPIVFMIVRSLFRKIKKNCKSENNWFLAFVSSSRNPVLNLYHPHIGVIVENRPTSTVNISAYDTAILIFFRI